MGHSYFRGNDEWAESGKAWDYRTMLAESTLEGQHPLPENETRQKISKGNLKIERYNLETDLQELTDVSAKYPEIVKKMEQIMVKEHVPAIQEIFKMKALGD